MEWRSKLLADSEFFDCLITSGHLFMEGLAGFLYTESSHFKRVSLKDIEIIRHQELDNVAD